MTKSNSPLTTRRTHAETPYRVIARVHACTPEFGLVFVRTADDFQYALTPDTAGICLRELREGQAVECLVSAGLPRVLSAALLER